MGLLICNIWLKPTVARIRPYDFQMEYFMKEIPLLAGAFGFVPVGLSEYGQALALGFLVIPFVETVKFFQRKAGR